MRILLLNRAFYPDTVATSQYATDIAHDLQARGHDVTVLSGRRDYTMPQKLYPPFEVVDGISVYRVSSTNFGKNSLVARILDAVSYDLASLARLVRLPRQDLVLAFTSPPLVGFYGALVARFWRARFVYWIMNLNHEMAIETGYLKRDGLLGRLLGWIHRFTLRSCDAVVVMDRWMKARVLRDDPIDASRVTIIPLWPVHEPEDAVAEEAEAFRKAHGLDGKFVVMHSGNLSHIHPLDTVLDAAVRLKDDPSIAFVFVGHGRRETDIDQRIRDHGLTNIVRLPHQPREAFGATLAAADLHLIVMGNAASGLAHSSKIYSILACGQPYLFVGPRDSHIVGDVLAPSGGGYHVDHDDVDGLVVAIKRAREMGAPEREAIRQTNQALVADRFGRQRSLDLFAKVTLASS